MPGVMACGPTREAAISAVRALALRVAAECIDQGKMSCLNFRRSSRSNEAKAVDQGEAPVRSSASGRPE